LLSLLVINIYDNIIWNINVIRNSNCY